MRDLEATGMRVVGEAETVSKAINAVAATRPDVVLLDLQLPDGSGVDVTRAVPDGVYVLVLSASGKQGDVLAAVKAGATGYLTKSASAAELLDAVRRTSRGEAVFMPALAGLMLGEYRRLANAPDTTRPVLTSRETEVLRLVAKGLTSKQIAARLVNVARRERRSPASDGEARSRYDTTPPYAFTGGGSARDTPEMRFS